MADHKKKLFQINLLAHQDQELNFQTRFLKWVLTSGKYIVIVVEVVVVGALVYRYKLDSDLAGIQDKIKQEVPYIKSLQKDEQEIRLTQFQLASIKQIKSQNPDYVKTLNLIASLSPQAIKLTNISFDQTQFFPKTTFSISGVTSSNLEVSNFIKALKSSPSFTEITLSNITFQGQTSFTITGSLTGRSS